jgi:hypothetical protein
MLLDAHSAVEMQKGHFHQQMHQLSVIYTLFYGGFMQPFQVSNGVKQVNGNPVKERFQDHERFAIKLFKACRQFMLRKFIDSEDLSNIGSNNLFHLHFIVKMDGAIKTGSAIKTGGTDKRSSAVDHSNTVKRGGAIDRGGTDEWGIAFICLWRGHAA